jgi:hypothetical protein
MYTAVLIDSLSIQQYIFSSNKLKEQIGASYIVEKLMFDECIPLALQDLMDHIKPGLMNDWVNQPDTYELQQNQNVQVEIGYIGGGNALIIFREPGKAKDFVTRYSRILLQYFPGLKTAYAIDDFYFTGQDYQNCRRRLNEQLIRNRNLHFSMAYPFKHGIVDDCDMSGEAAEMEGQDGNMVSSVSRSKQLYIDEASDALRGELLEPAAAEHYIFTDNQELLGQQEEKGYIAIVHADGNKMGQRFLEAKSLAETRQLSASTKRFAISVMKALIRDVIGIIDKDLDFMQLKRRGRMSILPIRPIIMGGDDITFVCEGRLGLYLAERLLKHMNETRIHGQTIQACAGVLLVHSKFPFYKGYKLCEEITKVAKEESRQNDRSWLHYHISSSGLSGTYHDILETEFKIPRGRSLRYGPYVVNHPDPGNPKSIQVLKNGVKTLSTWPRSKAKELRDILRKPDAELKFFQTSLNVHPMGPQMREHLNVGGQGVWHGEKTPFYDRIELLDYYPIDLL